MSYFDGNDDDAKKWIAQPQILLEDRYEKGKSGRPGLLWDV